MADPSKMGAGIEQWHPGGITRRQWGSGTFRPAAPTDPMVNSGFDNNVGGNQVFTPTGNYGSGGFGDPLHMALPAPLPLGDGAMWGNAAAGQGGDAGGGGQVNFGGETFANPYQGEQIVRPNALTEWLYGGSKGAAGGWGSR